MKPIELQAACPHCDSIKGLEPRPVNDVRIGYPGKDLSDAIFVHGDRYTSADGELYKDVEGVLESYCAALTALHDKLGRPLPVPMQPLEQKLPSIWQPEEQSLPGPGQPLQRSVHGQQQRLEPQQLRQCQQLQRQEHEAQELMQNNHSTCQQQADKKAQPQQQHDQGQQQPLLEQQDRLQQDIHKVQQPEQQQTEVQEQQLLDHHQQQQQVELLVPLLELWDGVCCLFAEAKKPSAWLAQLLRALKQFPEDARAQAAALAKVSALLHFHFLIKQPIRGCISMPHIGSCIHPLEKDIFQCQLPVIIRGCH